MTKTLLALVSLALLAGCASVPDAANTTATAAPGSNTHAANRDLGAFSISLAVKDLTASRAFYEKLGFVPAGGNPAQNWQILRNGDHVIGLFQGMFDKNILTFNPGWTQQATAMPAFTDIRAIQARLEQNGLVLTSKADAASSGPASVMLTDPDGNPILIDQHVARPK